MSYEKGPTTTGGNIRISEARLQWVRELGDIDLTMLLSEINDHGWGGAKRLIPLIEESIAREVTSNQRRNTP